MPTDWIFYWMTGPAGLLLIGMAFALSLVMWSLSLGNASRQIGFRPLLVGYACGAFGLFVNSFLASYNEFGNRVSTGLLQETQRWSIVPGWTVYISVLSLIYLLPLAMIVGVPLSAMLLRIGKLTYASIAMIAIGLWLTLAMLVWAFPTNEWHRTHRLASLKMIATDFLPGVALTVVPFLLGIYASSRSVRHLKV